MFSEILLGGGLTAAICGFSETFSENRPSTDGKRVQRIFRLRRPFPKRLRNQGNGRHKKKHVAASGNNRLGNFQRRESFARAARHDERASVGGLETGNNIRPRCFLMFADFIRRLAFDVLRAIDVKIRPINRAVVEVLHAQPADGRLLIVQRFLGVLAPLVRRGNNHPLRERFFARSREERIYVLLLQIMRGVKKLALDRRKVAGRSLLRDKINAGVGLACASRPFHPQPDIAEMIAVIRVFGEKVGDEFLEFVAKVALAGGFLAEDFENVVNGLFRHAVAANRKRQYNYGNRKRAAECHPAVWCGRNAANSKLAI